MKTNKLLIVLSVLVLIEVGTRFIPTVNAQGAPPYWFTVGPATHTSCVVASGATSYCFASDGLWESDNGAAWFRVQAGGGGVSSVFGRTGAIVAQAGDYSYAQLGNTPPMVNSFAGRSGAVVPSPNDYSFGMLSGTAPMKPSFNCATFSLINSANPPFAAGGCQ